MELNDLPLDPQSNSDAVDDLDMEFGSPIYIPSRIVKICDALNDQLPSLNIDLREQGGCVMFSVTRNTKTGRVTEVTLHICEDTDESDAESASPRQPVQDGERFRVV